MRISVIIPTLNESRLVSAAVSSAKQAGADEIIVVGLESRSLILSYPVSLL